MQRSVCVCGYLILGITIGATLSIAQNAGSRAATVTIASDGAITHLRAGILQRSLRTRDGNLTAETLTVSGRELLAQPASEIAFVISRATPDQQPVGLTIGDTQVIPSQPVFTRVLDSALYEDPRPDSVRWTGALPIESRNWAGLVGKITRKISRPKAGVTRLTIHAPLIKGQAEGLAVDICYEVYDGYAAIRKWVEITNNSRHWIRINHLVLDDIRLASTFRHRTPLTPALNGAEASVVGFTNEDRTCGVIAVSEIPSALRHIDENGVLAYRHELFEWILGPGGKFVSEPVFHYGFAGERRQTISAISTPLDRTVEGPYMRFVREVIGIAADRSPFYTPQWLSWASFTSHINDTIIRQLADLAAAAGFAQVLIDDGWEKGWFGTEPDPAKFPGFAETAKYVISQGLSLGLWVTSFRESGSPDLDAMPDARNVPLLSRQAGFAMSFSSPWRTYYADDLVRIARRYGVTYFKQDFTNILSGDFAQNHESHSRKESLLRGFRGLFEAQDMIRRKAPGVVTELTHEIYWGTPGVPADLAALKHASQFHIPPNDPHGDIRRKQPTVEEHRAADLRLGCWLARQRFYAYRGLPLFPLEYYAAITVNFQGSLTAEIQDRQVVSWLMGAPLNFSGDLRTLSAENLAHFRRRFEALARLQKRYDIYRHFEFSGVPEPTDTDWHWWGKLNDQGYGAVVVVRGSAGEAERAVNVPWVMPDRKYRITGVLSGKKYGTFVGKQLQDQGIVLELPVFGQEILELAAETAGGTER